MTGNGEERTRVWRAKGPRHAKSGDRRVWRLGGQRHGLQQVPSRSKAAAFIQRVIRAVTGAPRLSAACNGSVTLSAPWTTPQIIDQLNKHLQTTLRWQTNSLAFSFPSAVSPDASGVDGIGNFSPFNSQQLTAARQALAAFADVIGVSFAEMSGPAGNAGDLRFSNVVTSPNTAFAGFPGPGLGGGSFYSVAQPAPYLSDLEHPLRGDHAFVVYLHEIGHAMGFGHPGNFKGGNPVYLTDALFAQDTGQFTVMSYFQAQDFNNGNDYRNPNGVPHFAQTLMLYDIAALQATFGFKPLTRSGATTYDFNCSVTGDIPDDFALNPYPVVCIHDGGGKDRIDVSG